MSVRQRHGSELLHDITNRKSKAHRICAVLQDFLKNSFNTHSNLLVLDVGCSYGIISHELSTYASLVVGLDVDRLAVKSARKVHHDNDRLFFCVADGACAPLKAAFFDVVVCNHVYEHVPDAAGLFTEIYRILKPGGMCYLSVVNRLNIIEPHFGLPFLSWLPQRWADWYLHIAGKGNGYHLHPLTLKKILCLLDDFEVYDYTKKIILNAQCFAPDIDLLMNKFSSLLVYILSIFFYRMFPTYVLLLKKPVQ